MRFRIVDLLIPGLDIPDSPGSDDGHFRSKMLDGQFETDLIISLAGTAVTDGIRTLLEGHFHQALGNAGSCGAGAQKVFLINRSGFHGRNDVIIHIIIRQIQNVQLGCAGLERLGLKSLQFIRLSHIAGHRNHFTSGVGLFQPGNDDGRIESAGIGQNDFLVVGHFFFLRLCMCA